MPQPSESSSLLPHQRQRRQHTNGYHSVHSDIEGLPPRSIGSRFSSLVKAEGEPSYLASIKFLFFNSFLSIFLVFVPLSIAAHHANWDAALRFSFSFLAIVPLAKLLGDSTEQLSLTVGGTLAGLLNASFGNAVEIIVGVAALLADELRIVQTSMLGSILSNILLVLGCSFLAAGFKRSESYFQETAAQASASLMTLACITLIIPAAYYGTQLGNRPEHDLDVISRGTAILLLLTYVVYIYFQLSSHSHLFAEVHHDEQGNVIPADQVEEEPEVPEMNQVTAGIALIVVTVVTAFCADYLVASIEEFAERYHVPKTFIGLILLPIVANAAEHATSVVMAAKNRMELTIGICVGSSIQIAVFVLPLMIVIGWATGHNLTLHFETFETVVLFSSVLLVNTLLQDGKTNYMEGLMLIVLYFVIGLAFWVS
ncbi:Sodium/calcium exchanger protein-domain-containing protein [Panaeolus papilionaceus]|nr:Sodium/calcium exchanger protein-domain-containing protein [Panaeolus papilionaceus]